MRTRFYWLLAASVGVACSVTLGSEVAVLAPHGQGPLASVLAVALSPDGALLASMACEGRVEKSDPVSTYWRRYRIGPVTVKVWNIATREAAWVWNDEEVAASAIEWSPEGTTLAVGLEDGSVCLWDRRTGTCAARLAAESPHPHYVVHFDPDTGAYRIIPGTPQMGVGDVAWSPDGRLLVVLLSDRVCQSEVVVWDVARGELLYKLAGQADVAFNADGTVLATEDATGVTLWDARSGEKLLGFPGARSPSWQPRGKTLATVGGVDGANRVVLWDPTSGAALLVIDGGSFAVWSPDGRYIVTDPETGWRLWDVETGQAIWSLEDSPRGRPLFSADGELLFVSDTSYTFPHRPTPGGVVLVQGPSGPYDLGPGTLLVYGTCVKNVRYGIEGDLAYCVEAGIAVWDYSDLTASVKGLALSMRGQRGDVTWVGFTPDGRQLASASTRGRVLTWDLETSRIVVNADTGHLQGIASAALSPEGRYLATTGVFWDKTVRIWDLCVGARAATLTAPWDVTSVAWNEDGAQVAFGSVDGTVRIAKGERWEEVRVYGLGAQVQALAFGPRGLMATALRTGEVAVWDPATKELVVKLKGHTAVPTSLVFSPDKRVLASGSAREVKLWDTETWEELRTLPVGIGGSVAFAPGGEFLALVTRQYRAELWDVKNGTRQGAVGLGGIFSVAFSPDGRYLATGRSETVLLWETAKLLGPER